MKSPLDLIQSARQICSGDIGTVLCWLINQEQYDKRETLHLGVCNALRDLRLTGVFKEDDRICLPEFFNKNMAESIWKNLSKAANFSENSDQRRVEAFFSPDVQQFVPHAYPGRWAPPEWNQPLSPKEVREMLGLQDSEKCRDLTKLRELIKQLIESKQRSAGLALVKGDGPGTRKLRLGVSPYSDCLALHTLIYAVYDDDSIRHAVEFVPASFYDEIDPGSKKTREITSDCFDFGYATEEQIKIMKGQNNDPKFKIVDWPVFNEAFSRSVVIASSTTRNIGLCSDLVSFIGNRLAMPDNGAITLNHPSGLRRVDLHFAKSDSEYITSLGEMVTDIVEWEPPLIMCFAGGNLDRFSRSSQEEKIYALSLSTDTHLWVKHFSLLTTNIDMERRHTAGNPLPLCSYNWDTKNDNGLGDGSRLFWFIKSDLADRENKKNCRLLETLIDEYILDPIEKVWAGKDSDRSITIPEIRSKLAPIAQAMLAPLLKSRPNYNGPLLWLPPEAALHKVLSSTGHIDYTPLWMNGLNGIKGPNGDQSMTPSLLDGVRRYA